MSDEDIRSISKLLHELNCNTANLIGRFDSHIQNQAIHALPPCEHFKSLATKLWGIGIAAMTALIGVVYGFIK